MAYRSFEELEVWKRGCKLAVEVYVALNPTWLSVEADGNLVYSGVLAPQSVQNFEAKDKIVISSAKGNATYIKINGEDKGTLSKDSGIVKDVVFNAR